MPDLIAGFLEKTDKNTLEALVIGMWGDPYEAGADEVMAALIAHAPQLPNLRALFIGDMTYEECEISWIVQGSYKPLLDAFPLLQELRIRGGNELVIEPFAHQHLRRFTIEAGGLDQKIAEALAQSSMPQLEHLELWLGTDDYGFSGDVDLYRKVLAQLTVPTLKYLGLRDAEIADDLAVWLAEEPLVAQLDILDLSLGTSMAASTKNFAGARTVVQKDDIENSGATSLSDVMRRKGWAMARGRWHSMAARRATMDAAWKTITRRPAICSV